MTTRPLQFSSSAQMFIVDLHPSLQTRIEYDLPVVVMDGSGHGRYLLTLQKQSGTGDVPIKVTLTLPTGARLLAASPRPVMQSGASLEFDLKLDMDRQLEVNYALAH